MQQKATYYYIDKTMLRPLVAGDVDNLHVASAGRTHLLIACRLCCLRLLVGLHVHEEFVDLRPCLAEVAPICLHICLRVDGVNDGLLLRRLLRLGDPILRLHVTRLAILLLLLMLRLVRRQAGNNPSGVPGPDLLYEIQPMLWSEHHVRGDPLSGQSDMRTASCERMWWVAVRRGGN
jgi:hypothetical protein